MLVDCHNFESEFCSRFWGWSLVEIPKLSFYQIVRWSTFFGKDIQLFGPLCLCNVFIWISGVIGYVAFFGGCTLNKQMKARFPPLLSSSSWCKPLFWNNSQLGRNHSSPNYPTSQIFGKKTCSVKVFVVVIMGLSWWQSVEKMRYCTDQTVMKLQRKEHNILWGKLFPSLLFPHESVCGRSQTGAVPWYMASLQPTRGRAHWGKENCSCIKWSTFNMQQTYDLLQLL